MRISHLEIPSPWENHDPLQNEELQTTIDEIMEFKEQLRSFDITLEELVEQTPKQQRSLDTCKKALAYTIENRTLLQGIVETGRLPLKEIADGAQVSRKTLERHRKYLVGIFSSSVTVTHTCATI